MNKKLNLDNLKVRSFITEELENLKGGNGNSLTHSKTWISVNFCTLNAFFC
ncbi:MAG: pinensin family lanthipeptide [Bacteroidota bacterium]